MTTAGGEGGVIDADYQRRKVFLKLDTMADAWDRDVIVAAVRDWLLEQDALSRLCAPKRSSSTGPVATSPNGTPPNRKLQYERRPGPSSYDVYTWAGTKLGTTYKQRGHVWTIADPFGEALAGELPSRAEAGEALWQAMEARYAANTAKDRR